jgi:FlaA1/EpsC-like NDP-sugar epimerase
MIKPPNTTGNPTSNASSDHGKEQLYLARTAVACNRLEDAKPLLIALQKSRDRTIVFRAYLQMARVYHLSGEHESAVELLDRASLSLREQSGDLPYSQLLELARTWWSIGVSDCAAQTYRTMLKEIDADSALPPGGPNPHVIALVHYRLGELLLDESQVDDACIHWRKAFEVSDEDVSPYAARELASRIGSKRLPPERIERMYMHAAESSHLELALQARLELAEFLAHRRQFESARTQLELIRESGDPSYSRTASDQLVLLDVRAREAAGSRAINDAVGLRRRASALIASLSPTTDDPVIIVGAGTGGQYLLEALLKSPDPPLICGFVDDDPHKIPPRQLPKLGRIDDLESIIKRERPKEVLMAIPTASGKRRLDVVKACRTAHVPLRHIPPMHEMIPGWDAQRPTLVSQLRAVEIEETIGNDEVKIDDGAVAWAQGVRAMVVGAEGLGAEICRRLAHGRISSLAVVDPSESLLGKLASELSGQRDFHRMAAMPIDWMDTTLLEQEMRIHKPSMVIHAAGQGSDVVMENSPFRSTHRSVFGARAVAQAAGLAQVPQMLYVSHTRAANLDSHFGAISALAEEVVLAMNGKHQTAYAIVRMTPPMGSYGSIISMIRSQIDTGGPVTIPDLDATARMLSTARAAELILHVARMMRERDLSGRLALDAGSIENINEIAEEMIRLAGRTPHSDITIDTGARRASETPVPLVGEHLPEHREIMELQQEPLSVEAVEVLVDRLTALPEEVDDTRTPAVCVYQYALTIRDCLENHRLGTPL